jgi:hypothetical protein
MKKILKEFEEISGLECNLEKSTVMVIGDDINQVNKLTAIGFEEKSEITLLGMYLSNKNDILEKNAEVISQKLIKQVQYWSRFNLSLPGKVAIAKTMLYSQINYLGSFLLFEAHVYKHWEEIISKFVTGKMNIAKDRFFQPIECGGLGLFKIQHFLDAQKLGWVRLSTNQFCNPSYWEARTWDGLRSPGPQYRELQ